MGRHKKTIDRPITPDVKYNSKVIAKFVSRMMLDGKKATCTKIIYEAMDKLKAKTDKDPLEVLLKALDNVKPVVEVKSRRVGGATYQVPVEIRDSRRVGLSKLLVREVVMEWQILYQLNFLTHSTILVQLSKRRKIHTKWQKQTKLSLIIAGSSFFMESKDAFRGVFFFISSP